MDAPEVMVVARPQKEAGEGKRAFTRPSTRRAAKGPSDGAGCRSRIHRLEGDTNQIEKEGKGQAGVESAPRRERGWCLCLRPAMD